MQEKNNTTHFSLSPNKSTSSSLASTCYPSQDLTDSKSIKESTRLSHHNGQPRHQHRRRKRNMERSSKCCQIRMGLRLYCYFPILCRQIQHSWKIRTNHH